MKVGLGFLAILLLLSCQKDKPKEQANHSTIAQSDIREPLPPARLKPKGPGRQYAILPFREKPAYVLEGATTTVLTTEEIDELYKLVQRAVDEYNIDRKHQGNLLSVIELNRYRLQLIPVITTKGEKVVRVNAFCSNIGTDWRTRWIHVDNGGKCYFQVSVNLLHKQWHSFHVNGEA